MHPIVYHIVSGQSFFSGIGLLLLAVFAATRSKPIFKRVSVLAFCVGALAIVLSSTAIPYWFYAVAAIVTLAWIASRSKQTWRRKATYAMAIVWIIAGVMELPYHITPKLKPVQRRGMAVIGDSVTAGLGGDETSETWPAILKREHHVDVLDISHVGETAASALKRVKTHDITASVIVVEIGGNDILGSTTAAQFEKDLDKLLSHLSAGDRQVVMLELPLPPFFHNYGLAQRKLAAKHDVLLVPKRVFLAVIADGDSTLDTIHLSQAGHQQMANAVWRVVGPAFGKIP
jgi:acyl-CoA thioesterase-1